MTDYTRQLGKIQKFEYPKVSEGLTAHNIKAFF